MRKLTVILLAIATTTLMFNACGKYEEGPDFSLRTKTARITGTWEIEKAFYNGVEATQEEMQWFEGMTILLEKDGTGKMSVKYDFQGVTMEVDQQLEWRFSDDKLKLEMRMQENGVWDDWDSSEILKLTNSELWVQDIEEYDGETYVTEMRLKKI